jgi:tryptophanyl-tRNA synthetase
MTVAPGGPQLREGSERAAAALLACGVEPGERCGVYVQSSLAGYHAELQWLLSCIAKLGVLRRMTQFKQKSQQQREKEGHSVEHGDGDDDALLEGGSNLGLLSYPVLMAADILLFRATHIPVGDDQRQHLELAASLARGFNRTYKGGKSDALLPLPVPRPIWGEAPRVMGLRDPANKMSKSGPAASRIDLTDSEDEIRRKIRRAVTDSLGDIGHCGDADQDQSAWAARRPGVWNLATILAALEERDVVDVLRAHAGASTSQFKDAVAEAVVGAVCPVGARMHDLLAGDRGAVRDVLHAGSQFAEARAAQTLDAIREQTGAFPRP